jgi:CheY-like chemotaxis protein/predicted regulator of Ras-like GTPase activity (Roadblock/LC7/MglB family)
MPKVLVVDDSLSVRKVVQRALESKRIEVLSAASGSEAMEQIAREAPDLIVCDVIMPDMDGYQICDFVKKHPTLGHTPVLLISGIVNSTVLERAAKVRSDDVMRKPFAADELLHRIESLLPAAGRPAPVAVPAPATEATPVAAAAAPVTAPERRASQLERPVPVVEPMRAAVVAPAPAPGPDLKTLLAGVAELAGVSLTALIDREGALMEVAGGLLPEAELAGALAACLVESTDGVGRALTQGRLQSLILEYDAGVVLLNAVGAGAMLAVVLGDPAVLGKVRYHVKKALPDLVRAV